MTMTRSNTPTPPPGTSLSSTRHTPSQRSPVDTQRQGNAFQQEMDRLSRDSASEEKNSPEAARAEKAKITDDPDTSGGSSEQEQREATGNTAIGGHAAFRSAMVKAPASVDAPTVPSEHLDRIAAAIHELTANGVEANYQLKLPAGQAMIDGAVLGRDAAGRITIQLLASAAIPPGMVQILQQGLTQRLRERQLRLGKIGVSEAPKRAIASAARG
jgi:hypothetical protein